jgi:hypothetical protein
MKKSTEDKKKLVIGLYGEMHLAMLLHEKGWQVHRSYIDESIDFVITKYFCNLCKKYTKQYIRKTDYKGKEKKCVTNLCDLCQKTKIDIFSKYLQVKTSEGITVKDDNNSRDFSFHPKIRYNMGGNIYYVWIAVFPKEFLQQKDKQIHHPIIHFYIFNATEVEKFDNIEIDTYQITDNQKTSLRIDTEGKIVTEGKKYDYSCFKDFHNDFNCLDEIINNK